MTDAPPRPPILVRILALPPAVPLAVASVIFCLLSLTSLLGETATYDEPAHLGAGYSYLITGDYRMNPEHPALGKLVAALPLMFQDVRWPKDEASWKSGKQFAFGYSLLYGSGNHADRMLFWARIPTLFWGLVVLFSVYAASRELYGPGGALVSLGLATFCPLLLGHSHLVTTDAIITAFYLLCFMSFLKLLERPGIRWAIATGLLLGGALLAKYSASTLLPILGWTAAVAHLKWRKARKAADGVVPPLTGDRLIRWSAVAVLLVIVSGATVWAAYGFRYEASPDPTWVFPDKIGGLAGLARRWKLLPEAYLQGYGFVMSHVMKGDRTFALGKVSFEGFWWYFPFAFLVKTPVATILLFGWGLVDLVRRLGKTDSREDYFLIPVIMYLVFSMSGKLNLGLRHLLPVFPFLMVFAGGIRLESVRPDVARWKRRLLPVGVLLTALSTLAATPYYLGYFNEPARLGWKRHEMLVGTNLDWGQDLRRLKEYCDRHHVQKLKLAYFGSASPRYYGLDHQTLPVYSLYSTLETDWTQATGFEPGDHVAISATHLMCKVSPMLTPFLHMKPVAIVGNSILVFRIEH